MSSWNFRSQDVKRLLKKSASSEMSAAAVQRLRWFVFALDHNNNVSLTCRHFGIARSSFLRWADRFDAKNPESLEEHSSSPHTVRTSRIDAQTIHLIRSLRQSNPKMSKQEIQKILSDTYNVDISASTVGRIITRYQLFFGSTPAHLEKRGETEVQKESATPSITEKTAPENNLTPPLSFRPFSFPGEGEPSSSFA